MLVSFPFRAFFGMHLIATIFSVAFSWAITTSENAPLWERRRKHHCFIRIWGDIDTEHLRHLRVDRGHSEADRQRVNKRHIVNIYRELAKLPTMENRLLRWLMLCARVRPKAWQTLLKALEKQPFRTADSVSSSTICLHTETAFKNKYGIKGVFAQTISVSCYDTALSPP